MRSSFGLRRIAAALLLIAALPASLTVQAGNDAELEQVRDRVVKALPDIDRDNIQRSPATGLYEVRKGSAFAYVTADGRFLVSGDVVDLGSGERLTERRRSEVRRAEIDKLLPGAVEFGPAEGTHRWITVFTDVDCEYCRLLHREVPELNRLGVGVRYVFFSKYGAPSKAFDEAQQLWCESDRKAVLDHGLLTGELPVKKPRSLCKNPITEQYFAASRMGLRGTPMAIFPDGSLFPGYAKATDLVGEMDKREAASAQFSAPAASTP